MLFCECSVFSTHYSPLSELLLYLHFYGGILKRFLRRHSVSCRLTDNGVFGQHGSNAVTQIPTHESIPTETIANVVKESATVQHLLMEDWNAPDNLLRSLIAPNTEDGPIGLIGARVPNLATSELSNVVGLVATLRRPLEAVFALGETSIPNTVAIYLLAQQWWYQVLH